ncbi:MAG: right-handed parallel beta-helix repeat-containing protein [Candidatus Eisenbacteria bacterium]|uniref:Right-handed parallel beta-helix repeat-containing protein n=1 Tax=Eiseniibacteriota bacterium TaxID=2212470 RepID=A0A956NLU6_UNCEI|nr:right-handed parallel beta-helix repeat-containing protein [Candidatus Eisenbacteria bacterium]
MHVTPAPCCSTADELECNRAGSVHDLNHPSGRFLRRRTTLRIFAPVSVLVLASLLLSGRAGATWSTGSPSVSDPVFDQVTAFVGFYGDLVVAGDFDQAGSVAASNIALWDGNAWSRLGAGFDAAPNALCVYENELYAAGYFANSGSTSVAHIARWDGSEWQPLGVGLDDFVTSLAVYEGKLFVGGKFLHAGGVPAAHLAYWDGASWTSGGDFDDRVEALLVADGRLFAGGLFELVDSTPAQRVASYDGSAWSALGAGLDGRVRELLYFDGGLVVGGAFSNAGAAPANNIARWDGMQWAPLGSGVDGEVFALARFRRGLAVGGAFAHAGGAAASHVALWDGGTWATLDGGVDDQVAGLRQEDGVLFAGGRFTQADGMPSNCISVWTEDSVPNLAYLITELGTGDFPNVQFACDAVALRDTVRVSMGGYDEDLVIRDKWFTIDSTDGRDMTSIRSLDWQGDDSSDAGGRIVDVSITGDVHVVKSGGPLRFTRCRFDSFLDARLSTYVSDLRVSDSEILAGAHVEAWGSGVAASVEDSYVRGGIQVFGDYAFLVRSVIEGGAIQLGADDASSLADCTLTGATSVSVDGSSGARAVRNRLVDCGLMSLDATTWGIDGLDNEFVSSGGLTASAAFGGAVVLRRNRLLDCDRGIVIDGDTQTILEENLLARCGTGIVTSGSVYELGEVSKNTVVSCQGPGIHWVSEAMGFGLTIAGNLVVGCDSGISLVDLPADHALECNDVWDNPGGNWVGVTNPTGTDGNISVDPLFCNDTFDDYSLTWDSPCAPAQQPSCGRIGALDVGCGESASIGDDSRGGGSGLDQGRGGDLPLVVLAPNPILPGVAIDFRAPSSVPVRIEVFDLRGRRISWGVVEGTGSLQRFVPLPGDASGWAAGAYLLRLQAGEKIALRKLVVLRRR